MTPRDRILALDVGTQSARALVFDPEGSLLDYAQALFRPAYSSPAPGWAEQDPDFYWRELGRACQDLWSRGNLRPESIAGLALTCQRASVVNLDQDGLPLRPAIIWLDQRRASSLPRLSLPWEIIFHLAWLRGTLRYLQAEAESNWIREHQPELWDKTAHYLFLSGYLNYRLTGEMADSVACQVGYQPFDYRRQRWSNPRNWKWGATRVRPKQLPRLIPPAGRLGGLTDQAAAHLGLPEGLPVIAGASDKACEVLGCGCLNLDQGCIGYGTTATINVNSTRYLEPIRLLPSYPSAQPGAYNLEVEIYRGMWMVTWFKEQFAASERRTARERGVPTEVILEELAAQVPPGSLGLILQPYWTPGLRSPGPEARGSITGFSSAHTKDHLYRALLEGLAYGLREGRERIERRSKTRIKELHVCGGGSKSDLMMRITADVFGLPATRPAVSETSGLGAAMLAAVGLGLHPDLPTAVARMASQGDRFWPDPKTAEIYDRLFRKVYLKIYGALSPLYRSIREITA